MKKILTALIVLTMLSSDAWAFSLFKKESSQNQNPIKALFSKKADEIDEFETRQSDIREIKNVLKLLTKYSNAHNADKTITLYDESYRSFDGFDYNTFKKMLNETFEAYEDITYKSNVQSINLYGDKAVVNLIDKTTATLQSKSMREKVKKITDSDLNSGLLEGECNYSIYMQKINNQWKIIGDNVISEVTSVKYGSAKEYPMEFLAPITIPKDKEYTLTLKMPVEKDIKVIASLGKEAILYPSAEPEDVFRALPKDGILERIVRSNKSGYNEYAMASVGIIKRDIAKDFSVIQLKMTGLAFLMQRVNLYTELNPVREEKNDKKEDSKNKG